MNDKTELKKGMFLFNQESNILLRSSWDESPLPYKRFLDRIASIPAVAHYLEDCVSNHIPEGFDAAEAVKTVAADLGTIFSNFSTVPEEESAEVYLILKEMVAQGINGQSNFYYSYGHGTKFEDMYKGFLDKVVRRLITNIGGHLAVIGIDMGFDDSDSVTNNFTGDIHGAFQFNQAVGNATIDATQSNGVHSAELEQLLNAILSAAIDEIEDGDDIDDIRDNIEIVRDQLSSEKPKRGVLRSAVGFLKSVNGGTQFAAAVADLVSFAMSMGIQL